MISMKVEPWVCICIWDKYVENAQILLWIFWKIGINYSYEQGKSTINNVC